MATNLRFNSSMWCNLAVALKNIEQLYNKAASKTDMNVLEWYIIRALLTKDGQQASEWLVLLDVLRRHSRQFWTSCKAGVSSNVVPMVMIVALSIHLTKKAEDLRPVVEKRAQDVEDYITQHMNSDDLPGFRFGAATAPEYCLSSGTSYR